MILLRSADGDEAATLSQSSLLSNGLMRKNNSQMHGRAKHKYYRRLERKSKLFRLTLSFHICSYFSLYSSFCFPGTLRIIPVSKKEKFLKNRLQ
jgi:hypothetical protein